MSHMYSTSSSAQKLRQLLIEEKSDSVQRLDQYQSLTQKIADYQMGKGPAPTEAEFDQWRTVVKHAVDLKTRLSVA